MLKLYLKIVLLLIISALIGAGWYWFCRPVRYAVFAGYNADGTIHPYVITYLKGLNEVSNGVVYIADSELRPEEEQKLKNLTIHFENVRHKEYDFGSYKRGFNWLKKNGYADKADEIIFANDSNYLLRDLKPVFAKMSKRKELDFWGDLQNTAFNPHVQTYFFVIRKRIIHSKNFAALLNSVKHHKYASEYITNYEVKMTPMLESLGYKWDSYMPYDEMKYLDGETDKNSYPYTLVSKYNHPFLKRRTFTTNLLILEDKAELLRYIKEHYPERYEEIYQEISIPYGEQK